MVRQKSTRYLRLPRFADPWAFQSVRRGRVEPAADIFGRPVQVTTCRRGGTVALALRPVDPLASPHVNPPARSMLAELWRRVAGEVARYRMSGLLSPKELSTIEALWLEGVSLRALARREGVAAQAVEARIERLKDRAPRFYRWWRLKNRRRARR